MSAAGKYESFVKDSNHFVHFTKEANVENHDILVSFDVVSLFTKVPILVLIEIIKP